MASGNCADEGEAARQLTTETRRLQCLQFALVAECDTALAHSYLAKNDWDTDKALSAYFEAVDKNPKDTAWSRPPTLTFKAEDCIDLTEEENMEDFTRETKPAPNVEDGGMFTFITWNIDGLDASNLRERARAVCTFLSCYSPEVVFLQEVTPLYCVYLKKMESSYTMITGNEEGYFTAILLKKGKVKFINKEITPFPSTKMMRNLLRAHVSISGHEFHLMTAHLESTRQHAAERMNQLKMVFQKMQEAPESTAVIFAGDTNLRDQEVTKSGGLPGDILDVWEFLGKPKHCRYTWDTTMNTNLAIPAACKHRFDRIYFRAREGQLIPQALELVGTDRLECGKFPSDHWGLLCVLNVVL